MLTETQLRALKRDHAGPNRLARAIAMAGTTQLKVQYLTGIPQSYVSAIANGRYGASGLPVETARKLAACFNCTIEDLFPLRSAGKAA